MEGVALGRMAVCATILAGAAIIPLQVTAFVDALLDFRRDLEAKKSQIFIRTGIDRIDVTTEQDYVTALTRFFQKRSRRLSRV